MKILFLNTFYSPYYGGGAEVILKTLAEGTKKAGHEVVVLTLSPEGGLHGDIVDNVKVLRAKLANIYWPLSTFERPFWQRFLWHAKDIYNTAMGNVVRQVINREKPDIINCHNIAGWSASAWNAINQAGIPIVQVLHDLYTICPNSNMFRNGKACARQCFRCKLFRLKHKTLSKKIPAVVGVSKFILDYHIAFNYFSMSKVKTFIHNPRYLQLRPLNELNTSISKIRFGFIGTLNSAKGIEILIKAFSEILHSNSLLLIAGKGKKTFEEKLKSKNPKNIYFLDYMRPSDFFPLIDVLIVPSIWNDTFPTVIIESFAHGIPVIGSRRGGIPEMINVGENGFLFEPNNPHELHALLTKFIENPTLIRDMRCNAIKSAASFSDIDEWVNQYLSLFMKLM